MPLSRRGRQGTGDDDAQCIGMPLTAPEGCNLGTLCVLDRDTASRQRVALASIMGTLLGAWIASYIPDRPLKIFFIVFLFLQR